MIRVLFSLFFWVTVAKWGYQEAALVAPDSIPHIDRILEIATIPTHDQWPELSVVSSGDSYVIKILNHETDYTPEINIEQSISSDDFNKYYEKLSILIEQ